MGISIVNGAQTTGAIGSLTVGPLRTANVPARFVCCKSSDVINDIIRFNNSQNIVEAPDFRSSDKVQRPLREQFSCIPQVTYLGGRRGGFEDRIKRPANLLPSDTAGQALAAFHGDPLVAYNEKSRIWISDTLYSKYFSDRTSAEHIVFAYSLVRAVEERKRQLVEASNGGAPTQKQAQTLSFLRNRGATFLLTAAIADSLETVLGRAIPDRFALFFSNNLSPFEASEIWSPIVNVSSAFSERLNPAVERGLNSAEQVTKVITDFSSFLEATAEVNSEVYKTFAAAVRTQG